jgi:hypothetical protein
MRLMVARRRSHGQCGVLVSKLDRLSRDVAFVATASSAEHAQTLLPLFRPSGATERLPWRPSPRR